MARYMGHDGGYRAVIKIRTKVLKGATGQIVDGFAYDYLGPWDKPAQAKAAVTSERRIRGKSFVDGWIESATWTRVD